MGRLNHFGIKPLKIKNMFRKINWKYAIGEIAIVIIGITIAFSLNKWAERVKDRNSKKQYLESLIVDLDNEMVHLADNIAQFQAKIEDIKQIQPYLNGKTEGRDTTFRKLFGLAKIVHFHPSDISYKTLINSGDLGLFTNFELKKELENHYSNHALIQLDYERQNKIHEKYFGDFMIHHIDYDSLRQGDYSFMDHKMLKNIVQSLYGSFLLAISSSELGMERCKALKLLLQRELGSG